MDYISTTYDNKYFTFTKMEAEIAPGESLSDVELYDLKRQKKELLRCSNDFAYFCNKYVKIHHPTKGLIPLVLYNHQRRAIQHAMDNRFAALIKPRQMGLSMLFQAFSLWRGLFRCNETIMVLHSTDRESCYKSYDLRRAIENLPSWMKPELSKSNDHETHFAESGTKICNYTWRAARGRSIDWLIIDEAPRNEDFQSEWMAASPTIATGGRCVAFGSLGFDQYWWDKITSGENTVDDNCGNIHFETETLNYREHPDYDSAEWANGMMEILGERKFRTEVLCQRPETAPKVEKPEVPKLDLPENTQIHIHHHYHCDCQKSSAKL